MQVTLISIMLAFAALAIAGPIVAPESGNIEERQARGRTWKRADDHVEGLEERGGRPRPWKNEGDNEVRDSRPRPWGGRPADTGALEARQRPRPW